MNRLLLLLLFFGLVYTVATAITLVQADERAVVRRFGRIVDTPGPGLHIGLPWGMDRVDRIPIRLRRVTLGGLSATEDDLTDSRIPDGQLLTGDHNLVNVQVEIDYRVDEMQIEKFALQMDQADRLIARVGAAALAEWVAGRTVDYVLLRKAEVPGWLVDEMLRRIAPYDLGVQIENASVTMAPPADVKREFDEVGRAQTEIRTRINQAEEKADSDLRDTAAEIFKMERLAAAYAGEQILLAQADAGNFKKRLEQFRALQKQNPAHLAGIWHDEMTRLYTRMRQNGRLDLLDNHLGPDGLDITQLPLLPKKR